MCEHVDKYMSMHAELGRYLPDWICNIRRSSMESGFELLFHTIMSYDLDEKTTIIEHSAL